LHYGRLPTASGIKPNIPSLPFSSGSLIEKDEMLRTIPVLVVSTDGRQHRVQRMMSLGAKGYVKKPFTPERLLSVVNQVLVDAYVN